MAMQQKSSPSVGRFTQPLDRAALITMVILAGLIGLLVLGGDHTSPRVREFSWQDKQVGAEDAAFLLTFSRPMNRASVEKNLQLVPPLPGKFSWAGRRMAYTLAAPAPYGTAFEVELQNARDRFTDAKNARPISPFTGQFRTRDRAFVYLGVEGDEAGRLVLENLTRQNHEVLTPSNLVVLDFKPYPQGDRILFSATDRTLVDQSQLEQKLYTVATGIRPVSPTQLLTGGVDRPIASPQPAGNITLVLDSQDYQNLQFDLSADGQKIVLQRANRTDPTDFGLWLLEAGQPPKPLKTMPGGDFLIAPDSNSIAMSQGQGLAILPLESGADPLSFLAKFGLILAFSKDGSTAATVQFGSDLNNPVESLFVVDNLGKESEVLKTDGSLLSAEFDPTKQILYVLVADLIPNPDLYLEQPYLVAIKLDTGERTDLLKLPIQRDLQMSLAPDGLGILLDQVTNAETAEPSVVQGEDGSAIANSQLWFLPLVLNQAGSPTPIEPQALPLSGLRPQWLP